MSVVATLQTDAQAEKTIDQTKADENAVLEHLRRTPGISIAKIAEEVGWVSDKGAPNKAKVQRLLVSLSRDKLTKVWRRKWQITDLGRAELSGKSTPESAES